MHDARHSSSHGMALWHGMMIETSGSLSVILPFARTAALPGPIIGPSQ